MCFALIIDLKRIKKQTKTSINIKNIIKFIRAFSISLKKMWIANIVNKVTMKDLTVTKLSRVEKDF